MLKTWKYWFLFLPAFLLVFNSCNINNPVIAPKNSTVKSVSMWLLNHTTETKLTLSEYKEYDRNSNIIKNIEYDILGGIVSQTEVSYKDDEKVERINLYSKDSINKSLVNTYMLDNKGNISTMISTTTGGDTLSIKKYNYDAKGNLVTATSLDKSGNVISTTNYKYSFNNDGYVIGTTVNPGTNGSFTSKDTIIFNTNQRQVDRTIFNTNGLIDITYTYFYNYQGLVIKEYDTDPTGKILQKFAYEYIYY